jgi:hypothetical protein
VGEEHQGASETIPRRALRKKKEPDPSGSAGDEGIHTVTRAALKDEWT